MNAEFQRTARREKKACLSDQCKEIEQNDRIGKTRDLFKKIRDTKGSFHAKMGIIKDRSGMDLIETGDIKKRWQENTELYQKRLHDPNNHHGVITHLEPDILECEVKWAFSSVQFSSVTQSCPTLCDPMNRSTQASLSITNSWSLPRLMSIESVMPSNHLILCCPLLLLPSICCCCCC